MEWPSKSVPHGGMFHPRKVQYSSDTKNFLKLLMDESKLTNWQRNKINYSLRTGDPLPPVKSLTEQNLEYVKIPPVLIRPGSSKRRMKNTIVQSGAYERDKFIPDRTKIDREMLKKELQETMEKGKNSRNMLTGKVSASKSSDKPHKTHNRFDELVQEIQERQNWLKEMEDLGEAYKHRDIINLQIEERLREMEKLKPGSDGDGKK